MDSYIDMLRDRARSHINRSSDLVKDHIVNKSHKYTLISDEIAKNIMSDIQQINIQEADIEEMRHTQASFKNLYNDDNLSDQVKIMFILAMIYDLTSEPIKRDIVTFFGDYYVLFSSIINLRVSFNEFMKNAEYKIEELNDLIEEFELMKNNINIMSMDGNNTDLINLLEVERYNERQLLNRNNLRNVHLMLDKIDDVVNLGTKLIHEDPFLITDEDIIMLIEKLGIIGRRMEIIYNDLLVGRYYFEKMQELNEKIKYIPGGSKYSKIKQRWYKNVEDNY